MVSIEDWVAINDLLARYCWAVDENLQEEWVALWTEDGVFSGATPEPVAGREALKGVPAQSFQVFGGGARHLIANVTCRYGETRDIALVRAYNYVSIWKNGAASGNLLMAMAHYTLVRVNDHWLIKRNDAQVMSR